MEKNFKTVQVDFLEDHIAVITLNRPPVNALNHEMYLAIADAFDYVNNPKNDIRCVIVTAKGKMFCPGNDVNDFADPNYQKGNYSKIVNESLDKVMMSLVPVVCAVQGAAAGAGFCIPIASDVVIGTPKAKFGITELNVGIIGGAPEASYALPPKVVRYMALTGKMMSAEDMYRYNFLHKIVEEDKLLDEALEIARTIASHSPIGLRYTKESLNNIYEPDVLGEKVEYSVKLNAKHKKTEDFHEAVAAFLEKRKPLFKGR